jgi:hypothetical protein
MNVPSGRHYRRRLFSVLIKFRQAETNPPTARTPSYRRPIFGHGEPGAEHRSLHFQESLFQLARDIV